MFNTAEVVLHSNNKAHNAQACNLNTKFLQSPSDYATQISSQVWIFWRLINIQHCCWPIQKEGFVRFVSQKHYMVPILRLKKASDMRNKLVVVFCEIT